MTRYRRDQRGGAVAGSGCWLWSRETMQSTWLPKGTKSLPWICLRTHLKGMKWLASEVSSTMQHDTLPLLAI